jgi:hypothetical protein
MLLAWKNIGVIIYCGYILGFPGDTPESILEDIEIIKRELPIDILQFMCLTPLPGCEDHKVLWQKGAWMDPDLNKYDLEHVVAAHPKMSKEVWENIYRRAWDAYYTRDHLQTILRRGVASHMSVWRLQTELFFYSGAPRIENMHPVQAGAFRLKYRRDRRPALPIEPVWTFYPKYLWEIVSKHVRIARHWFMIERMAKRARREQKLTPYTDLALSPVTADETETLELLTHSEAARNAVAHQRKIAELTHAPTKRPAAQAV